MGAASGWSLTKTGDFDGDGKDDLLWTQRRRARGHLAHGRARTEGVGSQILAPGTGWSAVQVADLDGDGKADLVWQNIDGSIAVWLMNGTTMARDASILGAGTGWSVADVADFDGDGRTDLFWASARTAPRPSGS